MAKRPPALSVSEYAVMDAPESASVAKAVMPTTAPLAAFSATELAAVSLSVRTTRLSLTLLMEMVNGEMALEPSAEVALMNRVRVAPASASMGPSTVTTPMLGLMVNAAAV